METREDTEAIAAIHALSLRLAKHVLPPAAASTAAAVAATARSKGPSVLPADTFEGRVAAYAWQLDGALVPLVPEVRAPMVSEYSGALREQPVRDLYAQEQSKLAAVHAHRLRRQQWARA